MSHDRPDSAARDPDDGPELLTPGPTAVPERVRRAMARPQPNPDIEGRFLDRYRRLCENLAEVYGIDYDADEDLVVLGGEGILGLEAAIASLVEPGDRVLCVSNGLYGDGFADFVESYGGEPTVVSTNYGTPLDVDGVEAALDEAAGGTDGDGEDDAPFDLATMVHCETPTGTLNDLDPVLDLLEEHGVLSVVDAVSSLGGAPVPADRIDVCLGASQKCFSAPPGLTTASVSEAAWEKAEAVSPRSLYTNLLPWRDVSEGFPYTHLAANVAALDEAVSLLLEEGVEAAVERHRVVAERCRERGAALGLETFAQGAAGDGRAAPDSPTVSAFHVPGEAKTLQRRVEEEHGILLATGLGDLADDVLRVGHMGYNADVETVERAMDALGAVLDDTGTDAGEA
ncbi:pyridoxal-phosphate-dependent aminotransferase family protein [Halobium salinum]|uniref:Pyridoxal-phosphate-dependent aminotransferase family protein n=1 Tax=Halobium salinum TaxID=1364940 RepID=A0ABD5PDX2_9EURY|nr:alanine--glyoxylate aminotransferase family protein [Halobium salinum]